MFSDVCGDPIFYHIAQSSSEFFDILVDISLVIRSRSDRWASFCPITSKRACTDLTWALISSDSSLWQHSLLSSTFVADDSPVLTCPPIGSVLELVASPVCSGVTVATERLSNTGTTTWAFGWRYKSELFCAIAMPKASYHFSRSWTYWKMNVSKITDNVLPTHFGLAPTSA